MGRADASRRYSLSAVQAQESHDQWRFAAATTEGRSRADSRLYSLSTTAGARFEASPQATATKGGDTVREADGFDSAGAQTQADTSHGKTTAGVLLLCQQHSTPQAG